MMVSLVIPTYGRESVLCDSIRSLLALEDRAEEILVVDQTAVHESATAAQLAQWQAAGCIRWIRLEEPSITAAMNHGLREAQGDVVLFVDDDIVPHCRLLQAHREAYRCHPEAWAVVGQVLQPGDGGVGRSAVGGRKPAGRGLTEDLDFSFSGTTAAWVANVIACNLSVRRMRFLEVGGFDENFIPPVSFRFETEFARRLIAAGGRILFEPSASIQHLRAGVGGTRSQGRHLASASPIHGVGDYYYALCQGRGWNRIGYMLRRPFREVRTRYHLAHPWFIPVKLIGELRAMRLAVALYRRGPRLIPHIERDQA